MSSAGASEGVASRERVVVLHGLGRGTGSMQTLADGLEAAGFEVFNLDYPSTTMAPEALSAWVTEDVKQCCSAGGVPTHFVGHSLGGLLIRSLLATWRPDPMGRVVLLAPPNRGSEIVDSAGDSALFEAILGPTAVLLGTDPASFPNRLPAPDGFEMGIIAGNASLNPVGSALVPGDDDGTVGVEATRVEGARDFLVVQASHTFIMNEPEVIGQVVHFLRTGRFDRAGNETPVEETSHATP